MSDCHTYPAQVERDEDGRYVVTFPDFGWGVTDGACLEEALAEAKDLLRELIAATIREGVDLAKPSSRQNMVEAMSHRLLGETMYWMQMDANG